MFWKGIGNILLALLLVAFFCYITWVMEKKFTYLYEKYEIRQKVWSYVAKNKIRYYFIVITMNLLLGISGLYFISNKRILCSFIWYLVLLVILTLCPYRYLNYKKLHKRYARKKKK